MINDKKIQQVQQQIDETKKIMAKNIEKVIIRGQKLEKLRDKTQEMTLQSQFFAKSAHQLKRAKQWGMLAMISVLIGFGLGALYGLVSGLAWPLILVCSALGGGIAFVLTQIASALQQTANRMPLHWAVSPEREIEVLSNVRKVPAKKEISLMHLLARYQQTNPNTKINEKDVHPPKKHPTRRYNTRSVN
jgi:hypothetical protein